MIEVLDPFGAIQHPDMGFLARALDPAEVQAQFGAKLSRLTGPNGRIELRAIRVTRFKPQPPEPRCQVEYDLEVTWPDRREAVTLVGKARAKALGKATHRLIETLWEQGFSRACPDGVCVPKPIAFIDEFRMSLQRKVAGDSATRLLPKPGGVALARRLAEAAHKLHEARVAPHRRHPMERELKILHERLPLVVPARPHLDNRIQQVLAACDRLGAATPVPTPCGIHRDFYSDNVLVQGLRLYLVDFDMYTAGDPALDVGNFVGHLTEQAARTLGNPAGLADREEALTERFLELAGEEKRPAVRAYTTLTLVRHIYLSTQFPERQPGTELLLELCEERLGIGASARATA